MWKVSCFCQRQVRGLFASCLLVIGAVLPTRAADDQSVCRKMAGPESIAACSRLIKAGRIGGIELANIHAFRATTYRKEADYSQAIADFTQAIQLMENLASPQVIASAYVARASAYSLKGDVENALADYRKAVALDSDTE